MNSPPLMSNTVNLSAPALGWGVRGSQLAAYKVILTVRSVFPHPTVILTVSPTAIARIATTNSSGPVTARPSSLMITSPGARSARGDDRIAYDHRRGLTQHRHGQVVLGNSDHRQVIGLVAANDRGTGGLAVREANGGFAIDPATFHYVVVGQDVTVLADHES